MDEGVSYVLPVRWRDTAGVEDLAGYLHDLRPHVAELIVVDGSPCLLYTSPSPRDRS